MATVSGYDTCNPFQDEATASLDRGTDAAIQDTIDRHFGSASVIQVWTQRHSTR